MLAAVSATVALVALGAAATSRPRLPAPAAVAIAAAVSLVVSALIAASDAGRPDVPVLIEAVAMLALVFLVVRRAPGRPAAAAVAVAVAAEAAMIAVADGSGGSFREAAGAIAFWSLGAAGAVGAALRLNALDAERARSVADARRLQRLELARDLHDFVAHDVSAIVVDAQAGRLVGAAGHEDALAALERIEEDAQRALAAMDRTVRALRAVDDDASGPEPARTHALEDLPELAGRFRTSARARVRLDVEARALDELPREVSATGYRVAVEALTNVRRHAPAAGRVEIAVAPVQAASGPAIAITVTNDGVAGARPGGAGFGLIGLRERVGALGGSISAGPVDGDGWQLRAVLPHDGARRR